MSKIKDALAIVGQKAPEALETIQGVVKEKIGVLGENEVFFARRGPVELIKRPVSLSAQNGGLVGIPAGQGKIWTISAQGYEMLAAAANAQSFFPSTVVSGGKPTNNPFIDKDPETKKVRAVTARCISMRFNDTGTPIICDWTTIFDLDAYRLLDLFAKAKNYRQAFQLLPQGKTPTGQDSGKWAEYKYDNSVSLWVNCSHQEGIAWFSQIVNREKKAVDFAQTFARRNSFKHLFGLQKVPNNQPQWVVPLMVLPKVPHFAESAYLEYQDGMKQITERGEVQVGSEAAHEDPVTGAEIEAEGETDQNGTGPKTSTQEANASPETSGVIIDESGHESVEEVLEMVGQQTKAVVDHVFPDAQEQASEREKGASYHDVKQRKNGESDRDVFLAEYRQLEESFPDEVAEALKRLEIESVETDSHRALVMRKVNQILDEGA